MRVLSASVWGYGIPATGRAARGVAARPGAGGVRRRTRRAD